MPKINGSFLYQTFITLILVASSSNFSFSQERADTISIFTKIDSVVEAAIESEAFPGAVIMAANEDSVFFEKAYGYFTYDSAELVGMSSIYDLASITKVMASTLALMKMYEFGYFHLDDPIKKYVDGFAMNKRGNSTIRQLLAHQAGWQSWIRYYEEFKKKNGAWKGKYITGRKDLKHEIELGDSLYAKTEIYKDLKKRIKKCEFNPGQGYVYSGLFFYLIPEMVENLTDTSFKDYLHYHFYDPMQLNSMGFNPLDNFDKDLIVPTEVDTFFRMEQIHGRVHDEGAILMNGVSGNAGLFSKANDLMQLSIMLMNYGKLDSVKYLNEETVDLFTTVQYPNELNRRALGFDKPLLEYDPDKSSVSKSVSKRSFGHSGYTGTLLWIDPEKKVIFLFLSNRVFPSRENRMIYELNVRPTIQAFLYEMEGKL